MDTSNLPVQLTSFIGRENDLEAVEQLLATARLVTLTGPGGSGKTRLAIEVANRVGEVFEDGIWWVELASLRDPDLIPQLVDHTLGLRPMADQPMMASLINFLRSKRLLLILDNCEHLGEACAQFANELLTEAADLKILATSRESLGISGEIIYPVSGLSWPAGDGQAVKNLEALLQYDAVRLFVERAQGISPAFGLTLENAPAVFEICRRLDGLPLALELASARVNVLTVQDIALRLDGRLSLLTTGKRNIFEPRHQTLRAAIDWSYALLTAEEQTLLNRLAVFAAGFSLDTAEVVCAIEGVDNDQVLDLLSSLVDKSLIVADTGSKAHARYRLLETIREYALEKLEASGEMNQLRDRHLNLFLTRAEEAMPKQFEAYQQLWLNWLESDHDNVRAALTWALESKQIEAGLRLASAMTLFWEIRGYVREGVNWLERLLAEANEGVSLKVHVDALVFSTFHYMLLGDAQAAITLARKALDLAEGIQDPDSPTLAFARDGLASASRTAGDYQTAFDLIEQNIKYYRHEGPQHYIGMALLAQGENATQLGYYEIAQKRLDESLALARQDNNNYRIAHTLNKMGDLLRLEQKYSEAAEIYGQCLEIMRELDAQRDQASLLSNLGFACLHLGDIGRAYDSFLESMAIQQSQHNQPGMLECLIGFASAAVAGGQPAAGARLLAAASAISGQPAASVWKATQMEFEQSLDQARNLLSEAEFRAEQGAGRVLSLEQAVEFARHLPIQIKSVPAAREKLDTLTSRERDVAALIGQGKTNGEIADELFLSKRTIETHVGHILSKLGLSSRAQIIRWVLENELNEGSS